MLERYFVKPETVDRIRSSWIGGPIEQYVGWLSERKHPVSTAGGKSVASVRPPG